MTFSQRLGFLVAALFAAVAVFVGLRAADGPAAGARAHPLVWDAMEKTIAVQKGDSAVDFEFSATNRSAQPVEIQALRPSCGCTTTDMPSVPWVLAPGAKGSFRATVDFRGKSGKFIKTVMVQSSAGTQVMTLTVEIPELDLTERERNQQMAAANRQQVFHGACASCHAAPIGQKLGADLFQAACAICHEAPHRASMVPDLQAAAAPRDAQYWAKWIGEGKRGTLMPAFAQQHGGPLTDAQINSLVAYALERLPTQPRP